MISFRGAQRLAQQRLEGVASPQEQRFLLEALLKKPWADVLARPETPLTAEQCETLERWLDERRAGKPLQYVVGTWEFMGLELATRAPVLIPREDSEVVVRAAIDIARESGYASALDLCCGSGCLGVALAKLGGLTVSFADIDDSAIALTKENADRHGVAASVMKSDLYSAFAGQRFGIIVCNPPYIPTADIAALDCAVRDFEPHLALDGGADGFALYRRLAKESASYLHPGGAIALEVGFDQAEAVSQLLRENGWRDIRAYNDTQGYQRAVTALA